MSETLTPSSTLFADHPEIINWEQCLKLSNHNPEDTKQMIGYLVAELISDKDKITKAYQAKEFENLRDIVHRLKGALCYVSTPKLTTLVKLIEQACHAKQPDTVDEIYPQLLAAINEVIQLAEQEPTITIQTLEQP